LNFSRLTWQFPTRRLGETSGSYVVYIYNPGSPAVRFSSIQFNGGNAQEFAITRNTCGSALAPYTTCAVAFNFSPKAVGERRTSLIFNDDAGGSPQIVSVSGIGARQLLKFSQPTWRFPARRVGETSGSYVAYVYNPGIPAIRFASIQLTGNNSQDFAITRNTCGSMLAPYTTCAVAFDFTPTVAGNRLTNLVFVTDVGRPQAVTISGYAISK
jgi:hypothetical protein